MRICLVKLPHGYIGMFAILLRSNSVNVSICCSAESIYCVWVGMMVIIVAAVSVVPLLAFGCLHFLL